MGQSILPCCREKEILGSEVSIADAFRFKGALPEVANSRLAMLGEIFNATAAQRWCMHLLVGEPLAM